MGSVNGECGAEGRVIRPGSVQGLIEVEARHGRCGGRVPQRGLIKRAGEPGVEFGWIAAGSVRNAIRRISPWQRAQHAASHPAEKHRVTMQEETQPPGKGHRPLTYRHLPEQTLCEQCVVPGEPTNKDRGPALPLKSRSEVRPSVARAGNASVLRTPHRAHPFALRLDALRIIGI